jgi:hypothetical protein
MIIYLEILCNGKGSGYVNAKPHGPSAYRIKTVDAIEDATRFYSKDEAERVIEAALGHLSGVFPGVAVTVNMIELQAAAQA